MGEDRPDDALRLVQLRAQHQAIARVGLLALRERSRERIFNEVTDVVRDTLRCDFSKIVEVQPDGDLQVTAGAGWPDGVVGVLEVPEEGDSQASYALRLGQPVLVHDLPNDTRFKPHPVFLQLGVRSGLNVLIPGADGPYGILEADSRELRAFDQDEIDFLQSAANVLGGAIDRELHDSEREQFFDAMAHELRTPLAAVLGFSGRLIRNLRVGDVFTETAGEELTAIHDGARRMQRSMHMLFQVAQLGRDHGFHDEPVPLRRTLRDLVRTTHEAFPAVEFEEDYPEDELVIDSDEPAVRTVLGNIIENAAKYSARAPRVRVSAAASDDGVHVVVRDNCGGLSVEERERMFEQYYRGDTSRGPRGLGLGLYLAQRIASGLGWGLTIHDRPEEGCEVHVRVRRQPAGGEG